VQAEFSNTATPDGEAKQDNGPTQAANPVDTGRDVVGTSNAAVADPTGPPPANPLPVDTGRDVVGTPSVGTPGAVVTTNYQGQVVEVPPVAPPAAATGILDQDSWKFMVN